MDNGLDLEWVAHRDRKGQARHRPQMRQPAGY